MASTEAVRVTNTASPRAMRGLPAFGRSSAAGAALRLTARRAPQRMGWEVRKRFMIVMFFVFVDVIVALADWSSFALDSFNETFRPGLDMGRIGFVRVNVHGQREARVHAHQHVTKDQFAIARHAD